MTQKIFNHPRTELKPTVIFGENFTLDSRPFVTPAGRLLPGPLFSSQEYEKITQLVNDQDGALELFVLPTATQLARISLNATSGYWELPTYQDNKNRARYGQLSTRGIENPSNLAHRTMYMVFYGTDSLPNGRYDVLDHLCENKPCCYPRHLEATTLAANTLRGRLSKKSSIGQLAIEFEPDA